MGLLGRTRQWKDPVPATNVSRGRGQGSCRALCPSNCQGAAQMDRGSRLQQEGILLSPSPLCCSDLPLCPAQGPSSQYSRSWYFWGCEPASPHTPPPRLPVPGAYLAVTAQVIPVVQPLALGDGELVPPLHEVAQPYVHLPVEDPACRRRAGSRGRVVWGEPSQKGKKPHPLSPHRGPGTLLRTLHPKIVLFHPRLHL